VRAVYSFIAEEQANPRCEWSVAEMCRVLEVSRSGFYDWQVRPACQRVLDDRVLAREIDVIYECSGRTYGVPRMHRWLCKQGYEVSAKRVSIPPLDGHLAAIDRTFADAHNTAAKLHRR
jgi:putative transposase